MREELKELADSLVREQEEEDVELSPSRLAALRRVVSNLSETIPESSFDPVAKIETPSFNARRPCTKNSRNRIGRSAWPMRRRLKTLPLSFPSSSKCSRRARSYAVGARWRRPSPAPSTPSAPPPCSRLLRRPSCRLLSRCGSSPKWYPSNPSAADSLTAAEVHCLRLRQLRRVDAPLRRLRRRLPHVLFGPPPDAGADGKVVLSAVRGGCHSGGGA